MKQTFLVYIVRSMVVNEDNNEKTIHWIYHSELVLDISDSTCQKQ